MTENLDELRAEVVEHGVLDYDQAQELLDRVEAAEAAMQRVREVATGEPTAYGWGGAMDTIIRALDGGEQK